jgi:hypothetical protein
VATHDDRVAGGKAITYRLWQATGALGLLMRGESARLTDQRRGENAFVESVLINLRALIGFLLADAKRADGKAWVTVWPTDVKPSWYGPPWSPSQSRCNALWEFWDVVSNTLAHAAIKFYDHPGDWPEREALFVVSDELRAFMAQLPPGAETLLRSPDRTLVDVLAEVDALGLTPYTPDEAAPKVEEARRLLRAELGW